MLNKFITPLVGAAVIVLGIATPTLAAEPQQGGQNQQQNTNQQQPTPNQPQAQSKGIQFVSGQTNNELLASNLRGSEVRNKAGESIGRIDDIVLDKSGKISAIIVGVGGFLGLGSKDVGVAFASVDFVKDNSGNNVAMLEANKESLKAAPTYMKSEGSSTQLTR